MKRSVLLAATALLSGCGSLGKPPLPKFALGEAPRSSTREEAGAARLRSADVIYFGLTKSARPEPAWRIVETLQAGGQRVALGWSEISFRRQASFDRWQAQEISAPQLLAELAAPAHSDWLRRGLRPDLMQVALGAPRQLLRKIRAGETLVPAERALLPTDYRSAPDAFENFVEHVSASPRLRRYDLPRLYRAHLAAEQMIAENILRFRREHPEIKLLVFIPSDVMINPREVADFVAQKEPVRQLILDQPGETPEPPRPLLAAARPGGAFQIVDRAP